MHAGGSHGVLVNLAVEGDIDVTEIGKNVAMQIAAMNPTYWDQISAEDQQTIKSVLTDACVEMADQSMAKEDEFVQQFKDLGVTVSEADKASFAAVVPDLFTLLGLDPSIYDTIRAAIEANT